MPREKPSVKKADAAISQGRERKEDIKESVKGVGEHFFWSLAEGQAVHNKIVFVLRDR
jgi:hypothetical protein